MKYDPAKHHRRSIRLKGYDYTQAGAYFVTLCVQGRACVLGEVADGQMQLNDWGRMAEECWTWLADQYPYVALDATVIMPNHLHGIIVMDDGGGESRRGGSRSALMGGSRTTPTGGSQTAPTDDARTGDSRIAPTRIAPTTAPTMDKRKSLGRLVGAFKTVSTKRINEMRSTPGAMFWQRNYWEHIVRNDADLDRIREYIQNNPARWSEDQLHPDAPPNSFNRR